MAWWKRQLLKRRQSGFSLIELSMVLVAAGMVVGMGSQMMSSRSVSTTDSDAAIKKCYTTTSAALNTMNNALQQFFLRNGYYPLPAANNSTNGKQITMGSYGNVIVDNAGAPTIAIGRFPYATVGLTAQYAKDCFGNSGVKIASYNTADSYYRYSVSIDSASKTNYDANTTHGVVSINNTASASLNAKAIYAILSHGSTGCTGASSFGKVMNCATTGSNLTKVANPAFSRTTGDTNFFDDLLVSFSSKGDGCGSGTVTWSGSGGIQCSYNSSSPLKIGTSITVSSATALTSGSANLTCKNIAGSNVLSATGTCTCGTISNGTISPSGGVCTITCNGGYALSGGVCMPIVNGACGSGPATCSAGNLINDNGSTSCNTTRTWSCQGSNTGTTASCSAANAACPINGACGSEGACSAGNVSGDNGLTACGTTRVWTCNGLNGGSNASCSNTHSACAVNGVCGSSAGTCTAGTAINDNGQTACGNNHTWSCQGSNGGSTAPCMVTNGPCPLNGVCGSANNTFMTSAPTNNLCAAGTATSTSYWPGDQHCSMSCWEWTCNGQNSGLNVDCASFEGNCTPSIVANGTVAAYPSCAITCNSGYTLSGSTCVAATLPMITCPAGSTAQATPADWPAMSSWEADGSTTTFACPTQSGGWMVYYNQYSNLTGGAPATPSCPSGGSINVIRNRRVFATRSMPLPTANSTGYVFDGLYWSCTNYSGVCVSQATGTFRCS